MYVFPAKYKETMLWLYNNIHEEIMQKKFVHCKNKLFDVNNQEIG